MTSMDLSTSEPTPMGVFYGAFGGKIENATMERKTTKRNGATCNPFYNVTADFVHTDDGGVERKKKIFGKLPMDWKKSDNPFGQLYLVKGTEWADLVANFEKETHGPITGFVGAGRKTWENNSLSTYDDSNGIERISYDAIGFAPYMKDASSLWTPEMEETEKAAVAELLSFSTVAAGSGQDSISISDLDMKPTPKF
jgi:hypothetical protein